MENVSINSNSLFVIFFSLFFVSENFAQNQLTDFEVAVKYENINHTDIKRNNLESSIIINCKDGNKLFYFSNGKLYDKSKYASENTIFLDILNENILVRSKDTIKILGRDSNDKKVEINKIANRPIFYGLNKNKSLVLINDSLFKFEGNKKTPLGYKIQSYSKDDPIFSEKVYKIGSFITTEKSYIIESVDKTIYNDNVFSNETIKDFLTNSFFLISENLFHFNKNLSSIKIINNQLVIKILNSEKDNILKISDKLYFQNGFYYELSNDSLIKADVHFISQLENTKQTIKIKNYEISINTHPSQNNIRNLNIRNVENGENTIFSNVFLAKKKDVFSNSIFEGVVREHVRFTNLKDKLFKVETFKENHVYFFDFDRQGKTRYFELFFEDSLSFYLLDTELNYYTLSKQELVFKKLERLPVNINYFVGINSPGPFIQEKDSLYFPSINAKILKNALNKINTQNLLTSYNFSLSDITYRYYDENNYFLNSWNKDSAVFYNRRNNTFKKIVFKNYDLLKENYYQIYGSSPIIFFLKNDMILIRGLAGYVLFKEDKIVNFSNFKYGIFKFNNDKMWFKSAKNYFVLDDNFNIAKEIKAFEEDGSLSENWIWRPVSSGSNLYNQNYYSYDNSQTISFQNIEKNLNFIGAKNDIFIFQSSRENGHVLSTFLPEKKEIKRVVLDLNTNFYTSKLIEDVVYLFDSKNFKILKYEISSGKVFRMKNVLKESFLGNALKAKKGDKTYYINFVSGSIEIVDVTILNNDASIYNVQLDYFSQEKSYFYLGLVDKRFQAFKTESNDLKLTDFEWEEIKVITETVNEFEDIKIFPNPYQGYLNLVSSRKIESIKLYSIDGKLIFKHEMDINETNFIAELLINSFLRTYDFSSNLILNIETKNKVKTFRLVK